MMRCKPVLLPVSGRGTNYDITMRKTTKNVSEEEHIKEESNYLRGKIYEELQNELTGSMDPDDVKLTKFHGSY